MGSNTKSYSFLSNILTMSHACINKILSWKRWSHYWCMIFFCWDSLIAAEPARMRKFITSVLLDSHNSRLEKPKLHYLQQTNILKSRMVNHCLLFITNPVQLLEAGGGWSCRVDNARSIHFCSCSFRVSMDGPFSCSISGSSIWGTAISSSGNLASLHSASMRSISRPSLVTSLSMVVTGKTTTHLSMKILHCYSWEIIQ